MRFYIPKFNLEKLEKLVKRLSKKTDINFEVFDNTERQTSITIDGVKYPYTEIEVELDLDYKVGEYELVAQLEHTPNGNIIRQINPDKQVPERYRNTSCSCDHCHTNRERKNTFLLVDDNGDYKQVGKSCLNDFTGYNSESVAEAAASLYRIYNYAKMQNYDEDPEFMSFLRATHDRYSDTKELANKFYQLLRDKGYNKEDPFNGLSDYNYDEQYNDKVDELLNVVNTDWYDDSNGYCHNAKMVVQMPYVESRHWKILLSYLNSAMNYLQKQQQLQQRANADNNAYLGNVGDKVEFTIQSVKALFSNYVSIGYRNSVETITYKFITENGNTVLWSTGKEITDDCIGCKVRGTIKALKEYKGEKQTVITRAKIEPKSNPEPEIENNLEDMVTYKGKEYNKNSSDLALDQLMDYFDDNTEDDGFEESYNLFDAFKDLRDLD